MLTSLLSLLYVTGEYQVFTPRMSQHFTTQDGNNMGLKKKVNGEET